MVAAHHIYLLFLHTDMAVFGIYFRFQGPQRHGGGFS